MVVENGQALGKKTLALFFTRGMSLKEWDNRGLLDREIKWYNQLAKFFKRIYFFTYGNKGDLEYQELLAENIVIVPNSSRLRNKNIYSFLLPFIHRETLRKVDILKTNQMDGSWAAVIVKKLFKKPLVLRTGYTWSRFCEREGKRLKRWVVEWIERIAYSNADAVIVTSSEDLEYLREKYGLSDILATVVPNYVDTELFRPMRVKKKPNSLCFVGRLTRQKNLMALLEALVGTPYSLDIIGEGEEEENLKRFVKRRGLKVNFLGTIPNQRLPEVLNQYEVFVLPSLYEGMPKVLLEAMACGLPVIGTDVEGIREIIHHGKNGFLCGLEVESIKKTLTELMTSRIVKKKLGGNARKTIENYFSLESCLTKELTLLSNILE